MLHRIKSDVLLYLQADVLAALGLVPYSSLAPLRSVQPAAPPPPSPTPQAAPSPSKPAPTAEAAVKEEKPVDSTPVRRSLVFKTHRTHEDVPVSQARDLASRSVR